MINQKRLNKFLSEIGYCSRRSADKLIQQKRVTVNGKTAVIGLKVNDKDIIQIDGERVKKNKEKNVYLAFNKPAGIVCTTNSRVEKNNIIEYINYPKRIFPIGRLDKSSEGLIFLTDDGDIVNKILRARNFHEKEYVVNINKPITNDFISKLSRGVPILNTVTRKCFVQKITKTKFRIILTQGLNRQIRRMCEYLDYKVIKLKRIRIMNIKLDIDIGKYRKLTEEEVLTMKKLAVNSKKTFD
tara:strand:+ start:4649 stop:5374 length:726 start_codon:yes stop_codon:yes gene_type:complete